MSKSSSKAEYSRNEYRIALFITIILIFIQICLRITRGLDYIMLGNVSPERRKYIRKILRISSKLILYHIRSYKIICRLTQI